MLYRALGLLWAAFSPSFKNMQYGKIDFDQEKIPPPSHPLGALSERLHLWDALGTSKRWFGEGSVLASVFASHFNLNLTLLGHSDFPEHTGNEYLCFDGVGASGLDPPEKHKAKWKKRSTDQYPAMLNFEYFR